TELAQFLAALLPFREGDLAVLVRVEIFEPRRQARRQGAAKDANRERERAGANAVLARRDDAIGPGLVRAVDDARGSAKPATATPAQDFAVGTFQIEVREEDRAHVLDLVGFSGFQLDGENLEGLPAPESVLGRLLDGALVVRLAFFKLQCNRRSDYPKDFLRGEEAVAIQVVSAEFVQLLAA